MLFQARGTFGLWWFPQQSTLLVLLFSCLYTIQFKEQVEQPVNVILAHCFPAQITPSLIL